MAKCGACGTAINSGHYREDTGGVFCSDACLEQNLNSCGLRWEWDFTLWGSCGYITQFLPDGTPSSCNVFYTEFEEEDQ